MFLDGKMQYCKKISFKVDVMRLCDIVIYNKYIFDLPVPVTELLKPGIS